MNKSFLICMGSTRRMSCEGQAQVRQKSCPYPTPVVLHMSLTGQGKINRKSIITVILRELESHACTTGFSYKKSV